MYGLVNRAVEDLIISTEGKNVWQQIKIDAGAGDVEFLDSCNYDDALTFELVAALFQHLQPFRFMSIRNNSDDNNVRHNTLPATKENL